MSRLRPGVAGPPAAAHPECCSAVPRADRKARRMTILTYRNNLSPVCEDWHELLCADSIRPSSVVLVLSSYVAGTNSEATFDASAHQSVV